MPPALAPTPAPSLPRQKALFALLYLAEGGPIGLIWWALPTWLRSGGMEPARIAAIGAAVTWPWTLKFLVAPLVDLLRGPRFGLRAWLVTAQLGMLATLAPLVVGGLDRDPDVLVALLVLHAFCAATQDVAIDTLAVRTVPREHLGAIQGWMQVGMLVGRGLFGGGAILLARHSSQGTVMVALLASIALPTLWLGLGDPFGPHARAVAARRPRGRVWRARLVRTLASRTFWLGFALATLAGLGFEALGGLAGPYLLDRGASEELVGRLFLVPTVVALAGGALLGGWLSDRLGRVRATLVGEGAAAALVLALGLADLAGPAPLPVTIALLLAAYLAFGVATAAIYALLMARTSPRLAATQFAAFMGAINLCYVLSAAASTRLLPALDYGGTFAVLAGVSLVSLGLLLPLRAPHARSR